MSAPFAPRRRSRFISGVAWFTILGGAGGLLGGLVWGLVLVGSGGEFQRVLGDAVVIGALPSTARFIVRHVALVAVLCVLASAVMLATGIGLLRRREWARVATIWVLAVGVLSAFAGLFTRPFTLPPSALPASLPDSTRALIEGQMNQAAQGMHVAALLGALVLAAVNGLVILKLASAGVREEFETADPDDA